MDGGKLGAAPLFRHIQLLPKLRNEKNGPLFYREASKKCAEDVDIDLTAPSSPLLITSLKTKFCVRGHKRRSSQNSFCKPPLSLIMEKVCIHHFFGVPLPNMGNYANQSYSL